MAGLFQDPANVQRLVDVERDAAVAQKAAGFGRSAEGFMGGHAIGQALGGLFGKGQAEDPRVAKAKKMQEVQKRVLERLKTTPFDPESNSQLKIMQEELTNAGMFEEAQAVLTMGLEQQKLAAETENKQADTGKKLEDTGLAAANREARERTNVAGLPEAQVESERALAIQRRAAANKATSESNFLKSFPQTSRAKLGNAMAVFEGEFPELWGGMDEPTKKLVTAQVDALARTLERTVPGGPAQAMDMAIRTIGGQYVFEGNSLKIPFTDVKIDLPGGSTTKGGSKTKVVEEPAAIDPASKFRPKSK